MHSASSICSPSSMSKELLSSMSKEMPSELPSSMSKELTSLMSKEPTSSISIYKYESKIGGPSFQLLWRTPTSPTLFPTTMADYFTIFKEQDTILVDILSRLSVKSLLLCRCVCKSWRDLISSSDFVTKHLSRAVRSGIDSTNSAFRFLLIRRPPDFPRCMDSPQNLEHFYGYVANTAHPKIIDYQSLKKGHDALVECPKLDGFPDTLNESIIVGSCNGLICLLENDYDYMNCHFHANKRILLWNPSTRKTRKLPELYYSRTCPLFYGFGYDSTTQDYKVVLGRETETVIFAQKTGSWNVISHDDVTIDGKGCLLNGALHWAEDAETGTIIRSFDLTEEKFHSLSFICHGNYYKRGVGTMGHCLQFYAGLRFLDHEMHDADYKHYNKYRLEIVIWVMHEYGVDKSWTVFKKICLEFLPRELSWYKIISILEDGEILYLSQKSLPKQIDLVFYKGGMYKKALDITGMAMGEECVELADMYVETLVSP